MSKRVLIQSAVALGILLLVAKIALYAINWNLPAQQFRRAIAVEHSNYSSDEFGDYGHIVKGRIKDVPFEDLAKLLKLPSHTTKPLREAEPDAPGWTLFQHLDWWRLPDSFDEIYYDLSPGSQCLLGRHGDEVFLQDLTW